MIVNEKILEEVYNKVSDEVIEKAKAYVKSGRVKIYRIRYDDDLNFTINFRIIGHAKIYESLVSVEEGKIVSLACECDKYSSTCKHMLAGLIEFESNEKYSRQLLINNKEIQEENKIKYEKLKRYKDAYKVIDVFDNLQSLDNNIVKKKDKIEKASVRIVPTLRYLKEEGKFNLVFHIGQKFLYNLKDLPMFYDLMNFKSSYKYGPKLEFKHSIEMFDENTKKLMPYILKYAEIIKYANSNIEGRFGFRLENSSVKLNEDALDEFFNVFKGEEVNLENYLGLTSLKLVDSEPDILLDILKINDEEYKLTNNFIDEYEIFRGRKYIYFLSLGVLYRCAKEFEDGILKILDVFKESKDSNIIIHSEDLPAFFSLVVPKVRKNIKPERLESKELKQYIPKELGVKLFLDFNNAGDIICSVKFCYGEDEFNPFNKNEGMEIVRNINKENKTISFFKESGFEIDVDKRNMFISSDEVIFNFLDKLIDVYMEKFEVLVTDNFKTKEIKHPRVKSLGVRLDNNLLEIDFKDLDFNKSELKDILKMYNIKKKYYRLKDGSFLRLQDNKDIDFINSISKGMDIDYKEVASGKIKVPMYRSIYLERLLEDMGHTLVEKNNEYKEFTNKMIESEKRKSVQIPEEFNKILRSYQKTGFKWLKGLDEYNFGGILADDMGLGKTLQVITLIYSYIYSSKVRKASLVVCPSSLTLNWRNEVHKFAKDIKVLIVNGKADERKQQISEIDKYDIVITSYDLIKRDIEEYKKLNYTFKYVIADEAQYIKNFNTKNAMALKSIKGETRYALTGTPIENSLSELWSIFDYVMPGYLFSYNKFKKNFEEPIVKYEDREKLKRVKMLINPFVLRRIKKEVLTELPDKTITVLKNEMTETQKQIYLSYLANVKSEIENEMSGSKKNPMKILTLLTRLRQICCHPSLFIENYKGESSKLNQCVQIINDAIYSGHKILLFSQFTSMFEYIEKELKKQGIKYFKLTGSTDVSERIKMVDEFNVSSDVKVFLISLKAGGTGLNLTGADVVVHYDPWWNQSAENQATDRAYRIGQKNNVQVYKLITENSIEEKIEILQKEKAKTAEDILDMEESFIGSLSKEEIMKLFD